MAKRSRPAQGDNTNRPFNRPRAAYKPSLVPQQVSSGSVSKPSETKWKKSTLKRQAADATPTRVKL